ncbi:hypothetical protein [Nonomuraea angiospora]|uniref:hypothetical protein n=1 Tax=Nonomuraea angiospora TaxID=46172 RepID=UPI0029BAEEB9|nr:hypothetical protein [Nonomuraea angiospora]MDX3100449.1 hypothetical protein [Nonomuraea angiospora]
MAEPWTPSLEMVADHIPTRTRPIEPPGETRYLNTFTSETTPTDVQAQRRIEDAVVTVLAAVGGVVPAAPMFLSILAREAAALRAAADIEIAYPDRDADVAVYEQLNELANAKLERLVQAINDQGHGTSGSSLLPVWSMPEPPWWGDYLL